MAKEEKAVGASAKLKRARKLGAMGMLDINNTNMRHGGSNERMYSTLLVIALAAAVAWRLGEGVLKTGGIGKTGVALFDEFVLAPAPVFMGDTMIDAGITIALRTVLLLLIAGIVPAVSWAWAELIDRPLMSPYRTVWGVTLALMLAGMFLEPIFAMIQSNFVMLFG